MRKITLIAFFTALLAILSTNSESYFAIHETIAHSSTNCAITAGTSEAAILTAATAASVNACTGSTGTNVVNLALGTYSWTSSFNIPCGSNTWTLTGPVVPLAPVTEGGFVRNEVTPTAVISSSITGGNWGFVVASGCTAGFTLQYFEWNGNRPSAGGGGFGFANYNASNYTVQFVYAHGFEVQLYTAPIEASTFWLVNGCLPTDSGCPGTTPVASNVVFQFNRIGSADAGDCSGAMSTYQYVPNNTSGGSYGDAGGYCGTLGIYSYTNGVTIRNNNWFHIEQAGKCYAGTRLQKNVLWQHNDMIQIHRIGVEGQCAVVSGFPEVFDGNSIHDFFFPGYGTWPLSLPQSSGAAGSLGQTNHINNVLIENVAIGSQPSTKANCYQFTSATSCYGGSSLGGFYYSPMIEFWGNGTASHNFAQGVVAGASSVLAAPGCQTGPGTISYNTFQTVTASPKYNSTPNEQCTTATPPTLVGNTPLTSIISAFPSVAPSIAVSGNTVTITSNGYTSSTSTLPTGNTSAWYTTNGSTPAAGTSTFCGTSCTFTAPNGTVIKALAMWGAQNQPAGYAANQGATPSSVVSATVSGGGGATLTSCSQTNSGSITTISVGGTVQQIGRCTYSSVPVTDTCSPGADTFGNTITAWGTTNGSVFSVSSSGLVTGVGAGTANVTATATGGLSCSNYAITVSSPPTLVSATISLVGGGSTLAPGTSVQTCFNGTYSSGPPTQLCGSGTDANGTVVSGYTSSAPTVASMSSGGLLTGSTPGPTTISVTGGSFTPTLPVTVTSSQPNAHFSGARIQGAQLQ